MEYSHLSFIAVLKGLFVVSCPIIKEKQTSVSRDCVFGVDYTDQVRSAVQFRHLLGPGGIGLIIPKWLFLAQNRMKKL